ncbi:hypothetical protein CW713_05065 [Methanophagales archaeon]|nr:MAG: hypothetical protein CW713_05065 [Methanophagales archaeon]
MDESKGDDVKEIKEKVDRLEHIIIEGFGKLSDNELLHMQYTLKDLTIGLKEINERISSLEWHTRTPEIVIVEEMSKKEAKQKVIDYMRAHKTSDIAELHKDIRCDIRLLVDIIDELREEGKIKEER